MTEKRFLKQIENTQFKEDLQNMFSVDGKPMSRGMWNLIISKRDVSLWSKGIKPHRNWRVGDVKWYFGIKGGKLKLVEELTNYLGLLHDKQKTKTEEK